MLLRFKPGTEATVRMLLTAIILLNVAIPTTALALPLKSEVSLEEATAQHIANSLPFESPINYEPTVSLPAPTQFTADPDEEVQKTPEKDAIEFSISTSSGEVAADRTITINVVIRNRSENEINSLIFYDKLEEDFSYDSSETESIIYNFLTGTVKNNIGTLESGAEVSFSYVLNAESTKTNKLFIHNGEIEYELPNGDAHAQTASMGVADHSNAITEDALIILPDQVGDGWQNASRYSLYLGEEVLSEDAVVSITPADVSEQGPDFQFNLELIETAAPVITVAGDLAEQDVTLNGTIETDFASAAYLEINLDGVADLTNVPAGQEPYVVTYDEESSVWVKVPIVQVDPVSNTVVVEAAHFSTWGAGLGNSLPQNGANVLLFDQPYTSSFTGASRYSIPIWTPQGRAGMAPDVTLSYSSATVDGVLGDVQAPWTGMGWNIDGIEIVRKITTNNNGYGYVNEFALTLNGAAYDLIQDSVHPKRYYTSHDAFLYIERHNYAEKNQKDGQELPENTTGEWWEVVTTDGTRYRLGWENYSEQLALMTGYSCTTNGLDCITPDGAYASLGYAGKANDLVALRWRVDRVTDSHGNYIEYVYTETHPSLSSTIAQFDRESYLSTISYTGYHNPLYPAKDVLPAYIVHFVYANRSSVGDIPTTFNIWDNLDTKLLDEIEICYVECAGTGIVRTYDLGYALAPAPNANGTLTLTSLKTTGHGRTEDGQSIPAVDAPTIRFTYQNMDNRAVTAGANKFKYPRLVAIDNGAGGLLTYTYETDGRGTNSWYNYRTQQVRVDSRLGTAAALQSYTYATPVYTGSGGDANLGALIGYTTTTENQLNYESANAVILSTAHTFGTTGLDIGRELKTEWKNGSTIYRRTTNVYVTDNSKAPFTGWNFRYLYSSANFELSSGSLAQTSKTINIKDPATGNVLQQIQYMGYSLLRKTYYEYVTNDDPKVYILDKVSRVLLVDSSSNILSDTRYHYEGKLITSDKFELKTGDLTLVQRLTGNANETVDSATNYDVYGNVISTKTFKAYGTVNNLPSSPSATTTLDYDDELQIYPVSVTVDAGDSISRVSQTAYLFSIGLPYRTTDPNGWVSTTTYDGLGRTLSLKAPGLDQPGVYYSYPQVNGNGRLAAPYRVGMQILDTTTTPHQYRSVWGLYDGLERMIQTQVFDKDYDSNGELLVSDTYFNSQGLVKKQSLPYYSSLAGGFYISPAGAQFTESTFDNMGRVLSVTQPGGITSTTSYNGLTTTIKDPNNNTVTRTTDGLGRLVNVKEYSDASTVYASTYYTYDAADHLKNVLDAKGNETTIWYDWLGRKTGMQDPDMGKWEYNYNGLSNLTYQKDARQQVLTFNYDNLGRLLTKTGTNLNVTNVYDELISGGITVRAIGMRMKMSEQAGSTIWSYDNYGRTVSEQRTIAGQLNTMTTRTDWLGRPISITYPGNETFNYKYDALGRPKELKTSSNDSLVNIAYNLLGQVTTQTLGNGVIITNHYDSVTNRLDQRSAAKGATSFMDFQYLYDDTGNIKQIKDNFLLETHTYNYDFLNRLTSAEAVTTGSPSAFKYRQQFNYDQVGNITFMNDWVAPMAYQEPAPLAAVPALFSDTENNIGVAHFAALSQQEETPEPPTFTNSPVPTNTAATGTPTPWSGADGYTTSILHMDVTEAELSTAFLDETGKNWLVNGDAKIDTAQSKFGGASGLFDGNGDFIDAPDSPDFNPGAGDFTVDFWFKKNVNGTYMAAFGQLSSAGAGSSTGILGYISMPTNIISARFYSGSTLYKVDGTTVITDTNWHHYAAVRSGSSFKLFLDGQQQGSLNVGSVVVNDSVNKFSIGKPGEYNGDFVNGWIDEFRITKGVARWTSNFTPPTVSSGEMSTPTPFTASLTPSATSTVTRTSTPTPQVGGLMAYWNFENVTGTAVPDEASGTYANNAALGNGAQIETSGANGKSVFFDGVNDFASVSQQGEIWTTGSFTISAWVKPAAVVTSRTQYIVQKGGSDKDYGLITVSTQGTATPTANPNNTNANGSIAFQVGDLTPNTLMGPFLPVNKWTLVTGVYDSNANQMRLYLNGELVAAQTVTGTLSMGGNQLMFSSNSAANVYSGRLDEVRFYNRALTDLDVSGLFGSFPTPTPPATSTFTPTPSNPTIAPTAIPANAQQWGTGADGDLTINSNNTFNPNTSTNGNNGRTCPDAVAFNVTLLGSSSATVDGSSINPTPTAAPGSTPTPTGTPAGPAPLNCLAQNDEIMLIQLTDSSPTSYNAGSYEFLRIASINGNTINFTTSKINWYGNALRSDNNIGVGTGQIRVMLMRVPNYSSVTVNGTLTSNAFDGKKFGVIMFRNSGTLSGSGLITSTGLGAKGGHAPGQNGSLIRSGGGGGYGSNGTDALYGGTGGGTYGSAPMSKLFLGSYGGDSGGWNTEEMCGQNNNYPCTIWHSGPLGGAGGGIILFASQTITFTGTIASDGNSDAAPVGSEMRGGGGSGGSIRIEAVNFPSTPGPISATGGDVGSAGDGGNGRIAIYYYSANKPTIPSSPGAYIAPMGQPASATPSPTAINLTVTPSSWGTGQDGDLLVANGSTFDMSIHKSGTRSCADGVSYSIIELTATWAKLSTAPSIGCLNPNDEIVLMNMQGEVGSTVNTGRYEFLRVGGVTGDTVYFTTQKVNFYGANADDDIDIGITGAGTGIQQRVIIQRVPNYDDVEVNGTLTTAAWNINKNGLIVFRVAGELEGNGTIHANKLGYGNMAGFAGLGQFYNHVGIAYGGGAPGPAGNNNFDPGTGGGYGTNAPNNGGNAYGNAALSLLFPGAGGGQGGTCGNCGSNPGNGGKGGGIIYILAQTINFSGSLTSNGENGFPNGGASGAGGSIRIEGNTITLPGTVTVNGGTSANNGAIGRIALYYQTVPYTINFTPGFVQQIIPAGTPVPTQASTGASNPGTIGLVSWWAMDETSGSRADSHGTNALADNNTVSSTTGLKGNSASFITANQEYLSIADNAGISGGDIDFTLMANVYLNSNTSTFIILDKSDVSTGTVVDYRLSHNSGSGFRFRVAPGNGVPTPYVDSGAVTAGAWHTVIAWHDSINNTINIQVDNGVVNSAPYASGTNDTTNPLSLGAYSNGTIGLNGLLDEIAIYKRVLTSTERTWLYNNGAGRTYAEVNPPATNPGTTNLISWWTMNEASGTRNDSHGTNHLTDNNTVASSSGLKGSAANFVTANSEYLSIADNAGLSTGDIDFTLAGNVYLNGLTTTMIIANKGDKANVNTRDYTLFFDTTTSKFAFRVGNGTTGVTLLSANTVSAGQWYTVVAWHDSVSNTINIQINNGTVNSASYTSGAMDTTYPLSIGAHFDGTFGLNGRIDDLALYKRVLSAPERTWFYNNGIGRTYTDANPPVQATFQPRTYNYEGTHIDDDLYPQPHAVTSLTNGASTLATYEYDENGNMTCRMEDGVIYKQVYNVENRISSIMKLRSGSCDDSPLLIDTQWDFAYDGDGTRVSTLITPYNEAGTLPLTEQAQFTAYYFGGAYETRSDGAIFKYYSFSGQSIVNEYDPGENEWQLSYLLTDHLSSVVAVTDDTGALLSQQRYLPFGGERTNVGTISQTDYGYTGQRDNSYIKLMDYRFRWYSPELGRFVSPDSIIPDTSNPQSLNRYSYVNNNPVRYNDPTGHSVDCAVGEQYCQAGKINSTKRANDTYINLANRKGRNWISLSDSEKSILSEGGWDEGSFNDKGGVSKADALHDPATYIISAVVGGGLFRAGYSLIAGLLAFGSPAAQAAAADGDPTNELQTFYRGDVSGLKSMLSKAGEISMEDAKSLLKNGDIPKIMLDHAKNSSSPPSPFLSLTTDLDVAKFFAGPGGTVYTIQTSRAVINPSGLAGESEWLIPLLIKAEEIISTMPIK